MKIAQYLAAAVFVFTSAAFAQPVITKILSSGGSTTGGEFIYLMGTFPVGSPTVLIGSNTATVQQSTPNSILCLTPAGVGANLQVQVAIAGQFSNSVQYSYDIPQILNVNPFTGPTSGFFQIVITGTNFGTNPIVTIGGVPISGSMTSPTTFTGFVMPGQGSNLPIVVDAGGQTNITAPRSFHYFSPTLATILAPSNPTQGSGVITLLGSNFGQTPGVVVGTQFVSPILPSVTPTALQFLMPAGAGTGIPVRLQIGDVFSNTLNISYSPPAISSVLPANGPTAGGTQIELVGSNFGPVSSASIFFDNQAVAVSPISSGHTSLKFLLPAGQGGNHTIRVNAAGQISNQLTFNYDAPLLSTVEPSSVSVSGGELLLLTGNNFGLSASVFINDVAAPILSSTHTAITCRAPAHAAGPVAVRVNVAGFQSNQSVINYVCNADFNADGVVDFNDYLDYVDALSIGC